MKFYGYMIGALLLTSLLGACDSSDDFDEYAKFKTKAQTPWGQSIVDGSNGYVAHVKEDKVCSLASGVDLLKMSFLTDKGLSMQLMLFKVALNDQITLRTTLANDEDKVGVGQTVMEQLEAMQKNGKKVLGGTNADFFNMSTFIPYGVCYRDGVCVKGSFNRSDCNVFAVLRDNRARCLTVEEYSDLKSEVREAVCGRGTLLLKNGERLDQSVSSMPASKMEPRTCVGVSQDGSEVYLMVVDGRNFYYSNGANLFNLADLMVACGAYDALNLDGGGSSTFIAWNEAEGALKLLNWPTDNGGVMRAVATGLAIVEQ